MEQYSAGYYFKDLFIGNNTLFWKELNFLFKYLKLENIPIWIILITPTFVILSIPISYYIFIKDKSILEGVKKSNIPLYNFLLNKWYIDEIYDFHIY